MKQSTLRTNTNKNKPSFTAPNPIKKERSGNTGKKIKNFEFDDNIFEQIQDSETLINEANGMDFKDYGRQIIEGIRKDENTNEIAQRIVGSLTGIGFDEKNKISYKTENLSREDLDKAAGIVENKIKEFLEMVDIKGNTQQKVKFAEEFFNYNSFSDISNTDEIKDNSQAMRDWMRKNPTETASNLLNKYNSYKGKLDDRTKGKVYKKYQSLLTLDDRTKARKKLKELQDNTKPISELKTEAEGINYAITPAVVSNTKYKYLNNYDLRNLLNHCIYSGRHIDYYLINNSLVSMFIADQTISDQSLFPTGIEFDKENPDPRGITEYNFVRSRAPVGFFNGDFLLWDYCVKSAMMPKEYTSAKNMIGDYKKYLNNLSDTSITTTQLATALGKLGKNTGDYTTRYVEKTRIARLWVSEKVDQAIEYLTFFENFGVLPGFIDLQCVTFDHIFTYSLIAYFINRASANPYAVNIKPLWNTGLDGTDYNHLVNINSAIYKNENAGLKKPHGGKGGGKLSARERNPQNGEISLPSKPGFRKNFMVVDPFDQLLDSVPSDLKEGIVLLCKAKIIPKTILERFIVYSPKFEIVNYKTKERSHFYKFSITTKTFNKKLINIPRHFLISEKCNKLAKFYHCKYFDRTNILPAISSALNINYDYSRIYSDLALTPIIALLFASFIVRKEMTVSSLTGLSKTDKNEVIQDIGSNNKLLLYITHKDESHKQKNVNDNLPNHFDFKPTTYFTNIIDPNYDENGIYFKIMKDDRIENSFLNTVKDLVGKKQYSDITDMSINFSYKDFYDIYTKATLRSVPVIGSDGAQVAFYKNYTDSVLKKIRQYKENK